MRVLMLLGCAAALAVQPAYAQSAAAPTAESVGLTAEQTDVDPRAVEALKKMSAYLRTLNSFRLVSEGSLDVIGAFPLAGLILLASIGLARARILPGWYSAFGAIVALVVILHGTNWSRGGFWSATGGYVWVTILAGLVWALLTSALLTARAPKGASTPEVTATSPT